MADQEKNFFTNIITKLFYGIHTVEASPPLKFIMVAVAIILLIFATPLLIIIIVIYIFFQKFNNFSLVNKDELNNLLFESLHEQDVKKVKAYLAKGADVNQIDIQGKTLMHVAIEKKNDQILEMLLKHDGTPNIVDKFYGCTALYLAVKKNNVNHVNILIKHNADTNIADLRGNTPLALAVSNNKLEIVELLINNGADPNIQDIFNESPINMAISRGNIEIAMLLLQQDNLILDVVNKEKYTPLHSAISKGIGYYEVVKKILRKCPEIINNQDIEGNTPLHLAVKNDNIKYAKILLAYEAKIDIKNKYNKLIDSYIKNTDMSNLLKSFANLKDGIHYFFDEFDKVIINDIIPKIRKEITNIDEDFVDSNQLIPDLPAGVWPEIIARVFAKEIKSLKLKDITLQIFIETVIEDIFIKYCNNQKNKMKKEILILYFKNFIESLEIRYKDFISDKLLQEFFNSSLQKFPIIVSRII